MRSTGASSTRSPVPNGSRGSRLRRGDVGVPAAHHGSRPTGSQHGTLRVRAQERCHPSRKRHGLPDRRPDIRAPAFPAALVPGGITRAGGRTHQDGHPTPGQTSRPGHPRNGHRNPREAATHTAPWPRFSSAMRPWTPQHSTPRGARSRSAHWSGSGDSGGRRTPERGDLCMSGISLAGRRGCRRLGRIAAAPRG